MYLKSPFANLSVSWDNDKTVLPLGRHLLCDQCPLQFSSDQAVALHKFKAHGLKNQMRLFVEGSHCPACFKQFWTRERIANHIRYRSHVCRHNILLRGPCLSVEQADQLDIEERGAHAGLQRKGKRRHSAELPVVRLHGPLRTVFALPGCDSEHHELGVGHNFW